MRELLDAVALGTASPDEIREAEAMARTNPAIARELEELREVVGGLANEVPEHEAPLELKRSVLAEVRADVAASQAPAPRAGSRWWELRLWPVAAAVASVVAVALLVWNLALIGSNDQIPRITVQGTTELPAGSATVSVLEDDTIVITAQDFPRLNLGSGYEVWLLGNGNPVSAGFLSGTEGDRALAVSADLTEVSGIAITAEPLSNTSAPTTPILAQSDLPT